MGHKLLLSLKRKDGVLDSVAGRRSLRFKLKGTGSSATSARTSCVPLSIYCEATELQLQGPMFA